MVNLTNIVMLSLIMLISPLVSLAGSATTQEAAIDKVIPALEQKIKVTMKAQGIPGVAVAIVSKDKVYYLKTFGVQKIGKKEEITPTTLFQIGSLSKPINATMLAVLQDQGKLTFDDPVSHHIPGFNIRNNHKTVKICHLMSHSSGIANNGFNELIESFTPRHVILEKLQHRRAAAPPGKNFVYHNAMYGVLDDVIARASGRSCAHALQEELFKPLGMRHACLGYQALLNSSNKAYPHIPNGRGRYMPAEKYSQSYYAFLAAGGVNASVQDLVPFLQLYLGKPSNIVSKNTLEQLTHPFVPNAKAVIRNQAKKGVISNTYYGLGWHSMRFANKKIIYHQGHLKGFRNFMGYVEDDVGIIILTNAEKKHASKFAISFFDLYLKNKNQKS